MPIHVPPVLEYSREERIPQEAPHEVAEHKPPLEWPAEGAIEFKDVIMRYRSGLPFVLKGLSVQVKGGEKIGVVGRYDNRCRAKPESVPTDIEQ